MVDWHYKIKKDQIREKMKGNTTIVDTEEAKCLRW